MQDILILERKIENLLTAFPTVIAEERWLKMKKLKGFKFELVSMEKFEGNMIEKEHYFISGQFIESNNHTQIKYKIRANATFKVASFIIPLMAFPTLLMGMMGLKSGEQGNAKLLPNLYVFIALVFLSTSIPSCAQVFKKRIGVVSRL